MAITSTTTYMNLILPTPGEQLGPTWASNLNTALTAIDSHDHTSGKGASIGVAALTIDANLSFKDLSSTASVPYAATNLKYSSFTKQLTPSTDVPSTGTSAVTSVLFSGTSLGELYYNDGSGNQIQITDAGSINVSGVSANTFAKFGTTLDSTGSPYTLVESDGKSLYVVDTGTAAVTITLPAASTAGAGRFFIIKDIANNAATNNITINAGSGDIIGSTTTSSTSATIASNFGSLTIISRGNDTNWDII